MMFVFTDVFVFNTSHLFLTCQSKGKAVSKSRIIISIYLLLRSSSTGTYRANEKMGSGSGGSMNWDGSSHISKSAKGSRRWGKKSSSEEKGVWGERSVGMEKKRVMVVVDQSGNAKEAMMWALTHVANKGDLLTLLHVLPPYNPHRGGDTGLHNLACSLGALCKSCKPEVEVEVLVVEGPKLETVLSQVRKLETSVLVLSQSKPSPFCCLFKTNSEDFVEQCINEAHCLTMAVRKQSMGVGGYLVSTRWQKNFWLLA